ncbi:MAG: hypothetical protein ABIQ62_07780 [Thermomonas sp.]
MNLIAELKRRNVGFAEVWDRYSPPDLCKKAPSADYRYYCCGVGLIRLD